MRHIRAPRVSLLAALLIMVISSGCAGQGWLGTAKQPGQPGELRGGLPVPPESPVAAVTRADQILDLLIDDSAEVTLIKMTGNAPLQDYQFRRSGDRQFVLELSGIKPGGALNLLPVSSERLTLSDGGRVSPATIQILGTLEKPIDYYVLNSAENVLSLALHLSQDGRFVADAPAAPPSFTNTMPGKASAGPTPPDPTPARERPFSRPERVPSHKTEKSPYVVPSTTPEDLKRTYVPSRTPEELSRKREFTKPPISLDLVDADLKNVLRLLADIMRTNIVIEPEVSGRVTIKVEKVPCDQVLNMILSMNDLGQEEVDNVIRIARVAKLKMESEQRTARISEHQKLLAKETDSGDLKTVYLEVNYANPAEIAKKIFDSKGDKQDGGGLASFNAILAVDERSNLIIYTDYPARIREVQKFVARLDRPTPQVIIEARIITATQSVTKALGTEWHAKFERYGTIPVPGTRTFEVNRPADPFFGFSIASLWGQTLASIDFKLSALETSQEVNIVAAPKVLTINNVMAVISQGTQIPYLVRSDYGSSSTQFKDAVVELQVTPKVTPDQKVILKIQAKQDEPTIKDYQVGDSSVPGIETRKITTELMVDDGQVIVIGGVMRNREEESNRGTPGLKNIPILGWLFKNVTEAKEKTELLIFISPQIIESPRRGITRTF